MEYNLDVRLITPGPGIVFEEGSTRSTPPISPITGGPIKLKFGMNLHWVELHGGSLAEPKILTPSWVFIKIKGHFELICIK